MKTLYTVTGMTCNNCARKIEAALSAIPEVESAVVNLAKKEAVLTSDIAIPIDVLSSKLTALGSYNISPVRKQGIWETHASNIGQYMPLVGMLTVVVLSGFIYARFYGGGLQMFLAGYMSMFFILFGALKLYDLPAFVRMFESYDVISKRFRLYAYAYPFIEILLGIGYFLGYGHTFFINAVCFFISLVTSWGVLGVLRKEKVPVCACLGSFFSVPISPLTLFENLVMVAMSVAMLVY